jgi:mannose-6-phosphate isomerase-like protein (cupin superfamily)
METLRLDDALSVTAPDGSLVRPLLATGGGSVAYCTLGPGRVSFAVRHTVIEEIWVYLAGHGEMWRRDPRTDEEAIVACAPGLSITIPEGVEFQFRNTGDEPLVFLCFTMPPWPGEQVATVVSGKWKPTAG